MYEIKIDKLKLLIIKLKDMKKKFLLLTISIFLYGIAQKVGVNTTNPKAMLDVEYKTDLPETTNQTIGLPRVTTAQRNNFENLQAGQMIWNIDKKCIDYYDGTFWRCTNGTQLDLGEPTEKCLALVKDRFYGDGEHDFLYCEIEGPDGRKWLNNNLGAEYANTKSNIFNPIQQAISKVDKNAYGSLFQWQRSADGHELVNWSSSPSGKYGTTSDLSSSWTNAGTNKFIVSNGSSWVESSIDNNEDYSLWASLGATNPCPIGFHVPSRDEWGNLFTALAKPGPLDPNWVNNNVLRIPNVGTRFKEGNFQDFDRIGAYWSSTSSTTHGQSYHVVFFGGDVYTDGDIVQSAALGVRCIKDN